MTSFLDWFCCASPEDVHLEEMTGPENEGVKNAADSLSPASVMYDENGNRRVDWFRAITEYSMREASDPAATLTDLECCAFPGDKEMAEGGWAPTDTTKSLAPKEKPGLVAVPAAVVGESDSFKPEASIREDAEAEEVALEAPEVTCVDEHTGVLPESKAMVVLGGNDTTTAYSADVLALYSEQAIRRFKAFIAAELQIIEEEAKERALKGGSGAGCLGQLGGAELAGNQFIHSAEAEEAIGSLVVRRAPRLESLSDESPIFIAAVRKVARNTQRRKTQVVFFDRAALEAELAAPKECLGQSPGAPPLSASDEAATVCELVEEENLPPVPLENGSSLKSARPFRAMRCFTGHLWGRRLVGKMPRRLYYLSWRNRQ